MYLASAYCSRPEESPGAGYSFESRRRTLGSCALFAGEKPLPKSELKVACVPLTRAATPFQAFSLVLTRESLLRRPILVALLIAL